MPSDTNKLTAEVIVDTALAIANEEGLGALTMRRLGNEFDVAAMSLYWHVENKDVLLELMADRVLGELPDLAPDETWQGGSLRWFQSLYQLLVTNPAVARLMSERPVAGIRAARRGESLFACLVGGGLDDETAVEVFTALLCYTIGASLYRAARPGPIQSARQERFAALDSAEFPTVHRLWDRLATQASEARFRSGLEHLIAGFATDPT